MKVAVTYENGEVFQHFGHSEAFKLYEVNKTNKRSTLKIKSVNTEKSERVMIY